MMHQHTVAKMRDPHGTPLHVLQNPRAVLFNLFCYGAPLKMF